MPTLRSAVRLGWVGIDIGTSAVKLAQVRSKNGVWELVSAKSTPVVDGKSPLAVASQALEAFLGKQSRWIGKPAACVVSESPDLRSLEVPPRSRDDADAYLQSQPGLAAARLSTVVWPSTWKSPPSESLPCHVYAVHEQTADAVSDSLFENGAECQVLESVPHALARLPLFHGVRKQTVHAIVDWSAKHPLFVLSRNGKPYYTRLLRNCSYGQVVEEMATKLGISNTDVWSLLSGIGDASCNHSDLPSLSKTINELTQTTRHRFLGEVSRTLSFLQAENNELVPEKLWLVGGGAKFPGIDQLLSEQTKIPAIAWSLPIDTLLENPSAAIHNHSDFATAISLSAIPVFS